MEASVTPLSMRGALHTRTFRQCATALAWTLGLVGFFALWLLVERRLLLLPKDQRFVNGASLVPMVLLGVPHVLIGTLFLLTSPKVRSPRGWAILGGLALVAVALCALYALAGAHTAANKLPVAFVAIYFLVHELRDEAFFYQAHGEAPADVDARRTRRLLDTVTGVAILALAGLGTLGYDLHAHRKVPPRMGPLDYVFPAEVGAGWRAAIVLGLVGLIVLWRVRRWRRREAASGGEGGLFAALARHAPMLVVYGLIVLVLFGGTFSGSLLAALVLWHVLEWFLFALRRAGEAEARGAPTRTWLERARGTRRGFLTLHLGLAALVFVLMLVWAYGMHRQGPLTPVASSNSFYYWTIVHVTLSFFPR